MLSADARLPGALRSSLIWTGALAAFFLALFVLPYHVPVSPAFSQSYEFGYNNRAGQVAVAAAALLLLALAPRIPFPFARDPGCTEPLPKSLLYKALGFSGLFALGMYLLTRSDDGFSESIYLIDRVRLVLEGRIPYRNFEFIYGPLMLYGPAAVAAVLHVPARDGYGVFWILATLAGVALLFWTVNAAGGSPTARRSVFVLVFAVTAPFPLCLGLNYSVFRYIVPCALAIALLRRWRAIGPEATALQRLLAMAVLPLLAFCCVLAISPELGISFGIGVTAFQLLRKPTSPTLAMLRLSVVLSATAMLLVSWAGARLGLFRTLADFRSGGFNLPIAPAPGVLLLLFAIALCSVYLGRQLRASRPDDPALLLTAISAVSLAAAFGRCDLVHTLMVPFGMLLTTALLLAENRGVWRWYRAAVLVVFLLIPVPFAIAGTAVSVGKLWLRQIFAGESMDQLTERDRWILARMTRALGETKALEKFNNYKALANMPREADPLDAFRQPPDIIFAAPLGFMPSRFGIYHSPRLDPGYFFQTGNIVTPAGVQKKIAELSAHPARPLLLLPNVDDLCATDVDADRRLVAANLLYPFRRQAVHPENIMSPLCAYIHAHYFVALPATPQRYGYDLWQPRT